MANVRHWAAALGRTLSLTGASDTVPSPPSHAPTSVPRSAWSDDSSAGPDVDDAFCASDAMRVYAPSLLPRCMHHPHLIRLIESDVDSYFIARLVERTTAVVSAPPASPTEPLGGLPTPPTTPVKNAFKAGSSDAPPPPPKEASAFLLPGLSTFIRSTVQCSGARPPTLLVTLVYLERLRHRLTHAKVAKGVQSTYHRLFLACLVIAAKVCNDCVPKNAHWARWCKIFTLTEINLMEHELLYHLDHDLLISETEFASVCSHFLPSSVSSPSQLLTLSSIPIHNVASSSSSASASTTSATVVSRSSDAGSARSVELVDRSASEVSTGTSGGGLTTPEGSPVFRKRVSRRSSQQLV